MKQCVFILPYFGKFKNYFNMFLESCERNKQFDWIIVSDQLSPKEISNVRWISMSFAEFRSLIQSKFDYQISLNRPYKLCDYKPAYGLILEDYIKDYQYWGHCDCDLIFGDLTPINGLLQAGYDKIFTAGHLTIYKNSTENNRVFKLRSVSGMELHKIVYTHNEIFGFDEDYLCENVHSIFKHYNKKVYDVDLSFNISPTYYNLVRNYYVGGKRKWVCEKKRRQLLLWDGKDVYTLNKNGTEIKKNKYLYAHLLMRKYRNTIDVPSGEFIVKIAPESFELKAYTNDLNVLWNTERKFYFSFEIIKRFVRERYYQIKSLGELAADHNPYKKYRES